MKPEERRQQILEAIKSSKEPVSATKLAKSLECSRQVIVGDIALLRAAGQDIIATARGYIMPSVADMGGFVAKLVCRHGVADSLAELRLIVNMGGVVNNVTIEHEI